MPEPHIGLTITTMAGDQVLAETWRINAKLAAALRTQLGPPSTRQLVPVAAADAVTADVRHVVVPDPKAVEDAAIVMHRSQFVDPAVAGAVWAAMADSERERWRMLARAAMEMRTGGPRSADGPVGPQA